MEPKNYRSIKKDVIWNSAGTASWSFLSMLILLVVTRTNGLEYSGIFSFSLAFSFVMYAVVCYGGRAYQVSDSDNLFKTNTYISLRFATSALALLATLLYIGVSGYGWDKAAILLLLVGQRIFDGVSDVFYGILQKNDYLYISGVSLFLKSVISFVVFLLVNLSTNNPVFAALSLALTSLLFLVFFDIPKSRELDSFTIRPSIKGVAKIAKLTFLPFFASLLTLIFANISRYFMDIYRPDLQGYFGIIVMPLSLVALLFSFVYTPAILKLSSYFRDGDLRSLNKLVLKIILGIACVIPPLIGLTILCGRQIFELLFNVRIQGYLLDIVLIVVSGFAVSIVSLLANVAVIARDLVPVVNIGLASLGFLSALSILLVPILGIRGAILAYVISSYLQLLMMLLHYRSIVKNQRPPRKS